MYTQSLCSPVPDLDAGKVRRVVPWKSFHGIWYIMFGKSHRFQHTPTSMFAALEVNKNKKVLVGSWYCAICRTKAVMLSEMRRVDFGAWLDPGCRILSVLFKGRFLMQFAVLECERLSPLHKKIRFY